jgi:hypothetical protein
MHAYFTWRAAFESKDSNHLTQISIYFRPAPNSIHIPAFADFATFLKATIVIYFNVLTAFLSVPVY